MLTLLESEKNDTLEKDFPSKFCYNHYGEMEIWTGDKSPENLLYYEMKYDCLKTSGVKHGRDFCRDIIGHTENSTTEDLFNCYRKYGVEYSEEFCDYEHGDNDDDLIKCYDQKDVATNSKYCEIVYEGDLEGLVLCYEEADLQVIRACDLQYALDLENLNDTFTGV
jgi:hypothetical protein